MANALQTSFGRANLSTTTTGYGGAGEKYELYLKLFSGEMFKGFQHNTIARDLVTKRTLKNGKSLQFIYTGRMGSKYHTPGEPILGNTDKNPPVAEKTIVMDDLLISSAFVYDLDETLSHYDLRGEISRKIGYALAESYDRKIFRSLVRGARAKHPITAAGKVEPGGTQIKVGATDTANQTLNSVALNATNITNAFFNAAAALDEKGVSQDGRVAVISPRQYYALIQQVGDNGLINRDVQGTGLQTGEGVISIAGIKIFKSMNIPFLGKFGTDSTISNSGDFVGPSISDEVNDYAGTANMDSNAAGVITISDADNTIAVGDVITVSVDNARLHGDDANVILQSYLTGQVKVTEKGSGTFGIAVGDTSGQTEITSNEPVTYRKAQAGDGINNNYGTGGSFDTSCGIIFQREGAGVVEAIGPQVQTTSGDVSVIYQGDVILGRLAMGADYLNPAACVELYVNVPGVTF